MFIRLCSCCAVFRFCQEAKFVLRLLTRTEKKLCLEDRVHVLRTCSTCFAWAQTQAAVSSTRSPPTSKLQDLYLHITCYPLFSSLVLSKCPTLRTNFFLCAKDSMILLEKKPENIKVRGLIKFEILITENIRHNINFLVESSRANESKILFLQVFHCALCSNKGFCLCAVAKYNSVIFLFFD